MRPVGSIFNRVFRDLLFEYMTFVLRSKGCRKASYVKGTGRKLYRQWGEQIPKTQERNYMEYFKNKEKSWSQMNWEESRWGWVWSVSRHQIMQSLHEMVKNLNFKLREGIKTFGVRDRAMSYNWKLFSRWRKNYNKSMSDENEWSVRRYLSLLRQEMIVTWRRVRATVLKAIY